MNKISFVISGGVSLCTYEIGVLTSFYQTFLKKQNIDFEIVSGSSAGALSAFLFYESVKSGRNPFFMFNLIVKYADVKYLLSQNDENIFDFNNFLEVFKKVFTYNPLCDYEYDSIECKKNRCESFCDMKICKNSRNSKIKLLLNVTSLEPLLRDLKDKVYSKDYTLRTHNLDFLIDPDIIEKKMIFDILKASLSFPIFFPFVEFVLDRTIFKDYSEKYKDSNIKLNLTDGGITQNLPFRSIFNLILKTDNLVLIIPYPDDLEKILKDSEKRKKYSPISGIFKLLDAAFYQSLYSDIKMALKYNDLEYLYQQKAKAFENVFNQLPSEKQSVIREFFEKVYPDFISFDEIFTTGKKMVKIDIISPSNPKDQLGGEVLNHFGGFFDENMRINDFLVGYFDGKKYLEKNGFYVDDLFYKKKVNTKNLSYKRIRNKKVFLIIYLKTLLSILYPYRKNIIFLFFILFIKFFLKFLNTTC